MPIDFTKRLGKKSATDLTDPIKLYDTLDRKVDKGPLRPVQITETRSCQFPIGLGRTSRMK